MTHSPTHARNVALIFAGGVGRRMSTADIPKQFLEHDEKAIIIHTLEHFENHPEIDAIIVVSVEGWIDYLNDLLEKFQITKVRTVVPGGATGQLSIYNGLLAIEEHFAESNPLVLIHDAVRPLINAAMISKNISDTRKFGSSVTTAAVKETIILANSNGKVEEVVDRSRSLIARAPQCFYLADILTGHRHTMASGERNAIDSCSIMASIGFEVHLTEGSSENIKITTPDDFLIFEALEPTLSKEA